MLEAARLWFLQQNIDLEKSPLVDSPSVSLLPLTDCKNPIVLVHYVPQEVLSLPLFGLIQSSCLGQTLQPTLPACLNSGTLGSPYHGLACLSPV